MSARIWKYRRNKPPRIETVTACDGQPLKPGATLLAQAWKKIGPEPFTGTTFWWRLLHTGGAP